MDVGIIPHDYVKRILQQEVPLALTKKEHEILSLYYEHPYILHFFRYRDFLHDLKYGESRHKQPCFDRLWTKVKTSLEPQGSRKFLAMLS